MRKLFFLFFILFSLYNCNTKSISENEKLAVTAKIWGFLKYYHPEVGKGELDWDKQLFEIIPKIEKANNRLELSNIYNQWINSLGEIETCLKCDTIPNEKYFGKNFDLSWISDSTFFTPKLISKLKFIEKNRFQGKHYYFTYEEFTENIKITNEKKYENPKWQDKELRLLSLFRYWNQIEYFFPYKYKMDKDWDLVLKESIPNFSKPESEKDYHLAMLELVVNINDSHAYFNSHLIWEYFGVNSVPFEFKIINKKAIITFIYNDFFSNKDDIKTGDVVTKINGESIEKILEKNDKYTPASNSSIKLRSAQNTLFNGATYTVKIEYERDNKIKEKTIRRYSYNLINHKKTKLEKFKLLNNNIGYINMGEIEIIDVKNIMDSLFNTKSIVFDLRNYPKGTLFEISKYINSKPKAFVKFTYPDISYPGKFNWTENMFCGIDTNISYKGKVIILVNEETQSHAEFTAMCLQTAENAIIIGSQTSGADGNVSYTNFVSNDKTMFTGLGVYYPNGKETQRIGIIPDIEVKPTIEGIKKGKDEVLEKAIVISLEK